MVKWGIRVAQKAATGQLDMFALAIVMNDDIASRFEIRRTPANIGRKAYAQANRYDPSRMKDHISSIFSLKGADSKGIKTLGGTDGSRTDEKGCLEVLKGCD